MTSPMPDAVVATAERPLRPRALVPHEHGAWGQLSMPLVAALAMGRPTLGAALLAAAVVLAFVAHEPLRVLLGHRGERARRADGSRARRALAGMGAAAVLAALGGIALSPPLARAALALPAALAVAVAVLVWRKLEKTVAGEVAVAAALASASAAVALAAGVRPAAAAAALGAWTLSFAAATLGVQVILVRARSKGARDPGRRHAAGALLLLGAAAGLAAAGLPLALPLATAPTALLSAWVALARVSPKRLRTLGWALVGASVVTLAVLVGMLRE
jgi:hypothetical protein